jgi:hypothetical protein
MILLSKPAVVAAGTTWDPASKNANITLSGGNLTATAGTIASGWQSAYSTNPKGSGKRYVEISGSPASNWGCGFSYNTALLATYIGSDANSIGAYYAQGNVYINNASNPLHPGVGANNTVGMAIDLDGKVLWVIADGTNWNNGSGAAPGGTGGISFSAVPLPLMLGWSVATSALAATLHLSSFVYGLPTGFVAWDT